MIDVKRIRKHPEEMREAIRKRYVNPQRADLDRWLRLDQERRDLETALGELNAERNKLAHIGRHDPASARQRGRELRDRARGLEERLAAVTAEWNEILHWFPNWPEPGMPEGSGEEDNREERVWLPGRGYLEATQRSQGVSAADFMPPIPVHADQPDFTPLHHVDIGQGLGLDSEQGAVVSGSRFAYLWGDLALLQLAVHWLLIERLLTDGFQPISPPLLVRERALYGTSHFPEGRELVYAIEADNVAGVDQAVQRVVDIQGRRPLLHTSLRQRNRCRFSHAPEALRHVRNFHNGYMAMDGPHIMRRGTWTPT